MNIKLKESNKKQMHSSSDVYKMVKQFLKRKPIIDREKEHFFVIGMLRNNKIRFIDIVSIGSVTATVVHPMNVFRLAVMKGVVNLIICHNHPSGNTQPSTADITLTKKLKEAGKVLEIQVLDHIIIGDAGYYSFADEGMI